MGDLTKFLDADVIQHLSLLLKLLIEFDRLFLQLFMRWLGPPDEVKIFPSRNAEMPVLVIKSQSQ